MKFLLEILVLLILFLLLRQALLHLYPPAQINLQLSPESRQAFKRYRLRYALLYLALGLVFSVLLILFFRWLFTTLHTDSYWDVQYATSTINLLMPGVLLGFLVAHLAARPILARLQGDGLAFFMEELQELWVGWARERLLLGHMLLVLVLAGGMLLVQLPVAFSVSAGKLYYEVPLGDMHKTKPEEVKLLIAKDPPLLIFKSGDTLKMSDFNYNLPELKNYFAPKIQAP